MVAIILLPFGVQLIHILEKHEHSVCEAQNTIHFDTHKIDCSVFHFKINNETVDFSSRELITQNILFEEKNTSTKAIPYLINVFYKPLRAPPYSIVL